MKEKNLGQEQLIKLSKKNKLTVDQANANLVRARQRLLKQITTYNKAEIINFEDALNSDEWEKIVNDDSVIIKQKNKLDGVIYEIASDGTVTKSGDSVSPKVLPNTSNALKEFYDYILWKNGK